MIIAQYKKPRERGFLKSYSLQEPRHRPTFPRAGWPSVSSALMRFTALFGMGRGGSTSLEAPRSLERIIGNSKTPSAFH